MANKELIVPFIFGAEGGYANVKGDAGGETNKGITYALWVKHYGDSPRMKTIFLTMPRQEWMDIFNVEFWSKILGDQINDQRIAGTIADWVFMSGTTHPELDIEQVINKIFKKHIAEDGVFGPEAISAINSVDQDTEYASIIARRKQFYQDIIDFCHTKKDTSQDKFLPGWLARIDNLVKYNLQFASKPPVT